MNLEKTGNDLNEGEDMAEGKEPCGGVAPGPLFQGGGRADKMRVEESEWSNAG
jgi:hypothetical protein